MDELAATLWKLGPREKLKRRGGSLLDRRSPLRSSHPGSDVFNS